jgi:hypothetical protein
VARSAGAVCSTSRSDLEWQAMEEIVGIERARKVIDFMKTDHYAAIYPAVIEHRDELQKILRRYSITW